MYEDILKWSKCARPLNGLVLVKTLWSGGSAIEFGKNKIYIPPKYRKKSQPFTLALVLNPGKGYRDSKDGTFPGPLINRGDFIVAEQFVAYEFEVDGHLVNYIPESRILATVKDWEPSQETFLEM